MTLNILHIVTAFPRSENEDTITPWLVQTLAELENCNVHNIILSPSYKGLGDQKLFGLDIRRFRYSLKPFESLTHDEAAPVRISRKPWYLMLVPFYVFCGARAVKRILAHEKIDVIHVHWPLPNALLANSAYGKTPVLLSFYTAETALAKRFPLLGKFLKNAVARANAIIAISSHAKNQAAAVFDRPMEIVPYGTAFPQKKPQSKSIDKNQTIEILFVGRLVERKGVVYLIEAMPKIREKINAHLTIVGGGFLLPELQKHAAKLGMSDNITFTGSVPAEIRDKAYDNAHVFVLPACYDKHGDTEGLGVVLLESIARGVPVVASAVGGIVDIVKDGVTGLLVPEKDSTALANTIVRLFENQALYEKLVEDGFDYAAQNFSNAAVAQKIAAVYTSVCKNKNSAQK